MSAAPSYKICIVSSLAVGGAGVAARRLHQGFLEIGVPSCFFTSRSSGIVDRSLVYRPGSGLRCRLGRVIRNCRNRLSKRVHFGTQSPNVRFCVDIPEYGSDPFLYLPDSSIINLHHYDEFFDYKVFFDHLSGSRPVIWTLHDMHPLTGGCYYSRGCDNFVRSCGSCHLINSRRARDLSRQRWNRKHRVYRRLSRDRVKFVAPSTWLAKEAKRSSLLQDFDVEVVPNGIDTNLFSPRDPAFCKDYLGLPKDKVVVLFCSSDLSHPLKGLDYLLQALKAIRSQEVVLALLGSGSLPSEPSISFSHLGPATDERLLPLIYSAADLLVVPSIEDNLPNIVMESMSCGTPIVAFDTGGISDMVIHNVTGLVVERRNCSDLAEAISLTASDPVYRTVLGVNCRKRAQAEYSLSKQASRYDELIRRWGFDRLGSAHARSKTRTDKG